VPLKILCTVKRVEDYESKIKVKPDGSWIVTEGVNYRANPFDEIAVEEALRLQAKHGAEVVVASVGAAAAATEIRSALAMGADRGVLVKLADGVRIDSDVAARLLAKVVEQEKPDLVIMGKQAVDDDANMAGQILAELLGWGQATFASKTESLESDAEKTKQPGLEVADGAVKVWREVDGGLERLECRLPAVVTTDLRLNVPRYASLPNIMKAKKKPIAEIAPESLGVDLSPKVKVVKVSPPPERKAGQKVADVATLVEKLKTEAKVI
jgi:electron transfer flavoprotein beta subunit